MGLTISRGAPLYPKVFTYPLHYLGAVTYSRVVDGMIDVSTYDTYIDLDATFDGAAGVWTPCLWIVTNDLRTSDTRINQTGQTFSSEDPRGAVFAFMRDYFHDTWWLCFTREKLCEYGRAEKVRPAFRRYVGNEI